MNEQQIKHIDLSIEQAKANIQRYEQLNKLASNKEFKELILDGYFRDEASRLVLLKADPNMLGDTEQLHIGKLIDGIGALRQYFSTIERIGEMSQRALKEHEQTREELLQEEMDETGAHA